MDSKGLEVLATLKNVEELSLDLVKNDDQCLKSIGRLTHLRRLHLSGGWFNLEPPGRPLTEGGMAALRPLKKLTSLGLVQSSFDDDCCRLLPDIFPHLSLLDLSQTKISDAGLESIAKLSELSDLHLRGDQRVTDACIPHLARLKRLRRFDQNGTSISHEGMTKLHQALPGLGPTWTDASAGAPPPPARNALAAVGPEQPASENGAPEKDQLAPKNQDVAAAGEKALARLRQLGARVAERMAKNGERQIEIGFFESLKGGPKWWAGTDADFGLLAQVVSLGKVAATVDLDVISPQALADLKLDVPLDHLIFYVDKPLDQLQRLPACRLLSVSDQSTRLKLNDWRHVAALAAGVESLSVAGGWRKDAGGSFGSQNGAAGIDDDVLAELAVLKNLKSLYVYTSKMTDLGLKHLAGLKHLEELSLNSCGELQKANLAAIADFASLRRLTIDGEISAAGLANIARLGSLEELSIIGTNLEPADVEPLGRLTRLRSLSIRAHSAFMFEYAAPTREELLALVPLGNAFADATRTMPGLHDLNLDLPIDEQGLAALAGHDQLEILAVDLVDVDDQSLALIGRVPSLKRLRISGEGKLSDAGLAGLAPLAALADLHMPGHGLTDACLVHLAALQAIESIDLPHTNITGSGLPALVNLPRLKTLWLGSSLLDDDGCRLFPQLVGLESLDLSQTKITDAALESIARLPNLRELTLHNLPITDRGLAHLQGLKHLTRVYAAGTRVSREGAKAIWHSLTGVEFLDIFYKDGSERFGTSKDDP